MIDTDKFTRTGTRVIDMRGGGRAAGTDGKYGVDGLPATPEPPTGVKNVASWVYLGLKRAATAADVTADATLTLGQPVLSMRYVYCGPEIAIEPMTPHVYPEEEA